MIKRWHIAPPIPSTILHNFRGISPIVAQVLYNRGIQDYPTALAFLTAERHATYSPLKMSDMSKAVGRIRFAIQRQELMVIYGDFDADGVTSTALMVEVLEWLGAQVQAYIPHRVDEGYGLNAEALKTLKDRGVKLIITVDCGIRSVEEAEVAKRLGVDLIITDHHSLGADLPDAHAVINPKRDKPPVETMLAGVGVAYKLAEALLNAHYANDKLSSASREPFDLDSVLDLVAIGTVADLAPLDRLENRSLVKGGLRQIRLARRMGLRHLLEASGVPSAKVGAIDIGFSIGPRINAAGRLESAMLAYRLLHSTSEKEASELARSLQELNQQRQSLTREAQERIREQMHTELRDDQPLIFASHANFPQGIIGLVAGKLTEEYFRPSVVLRLGEEESHASCRSIPQFNITHALDECSDLLIRHGGHAQAAGFTIHNHNIPALNERLQEIATKSLGGQELIPTLHMDAVLDLDRLSEELFDELQQLEPTGHDNHAPLFCVEGVRVGGARRIGRDEQHLRLKLQGRYKNVDAVGFGLGNWLDQLPSRVDLAFQLEMNEWNGKRTLQLNVKDIRPHGENAT